MSDDEFKKDNDHPVLDDYLGEWTDELDGKYIVEFVSAGAKNYAKLISDNSTQCVVKGFQLSYTASKTINFASIKNIVLNDNKKALFASQSKIKRDKKEWSLVTCDMNKEYNMVYDKRILNKDFTTYPYGFIL